MFISDTEIQEAYIALSWFNASFVIAMIEGISVSEARVKELGREFDVLSKHFSQDPGN